MNWIKVKTPDSRRSYESFLDAYTRGYFKSKWEIRRIWLKQQISHCYYFLVYDYWEYKKDGSVYFNRTRKWDIRKSQPKLEKKF